MRLCSSANCDSRYFQSRISREHSCESAKSVIPNFVYDIDMLVFSVTIVFHQNLVYSLREKREIKNYASKNIRSQLCWKSLDSQTTSLFSNCTSS